jgi:hypothetical protein
MRVSCATETIEQQRESVELRSFFVRETNPATGDLIDPTGDPVDVSFAASGDRPTVWTPMTWAGGGPVNKPGFGESYQADVTVGGTGSGATVELAVGNWAAYVRVTAGVETPVLYAGQLRLR